MTGSVRSPHRAWPPLPRAGAAYQSLNNPAVRARAAAARRGCIQDLLQRARTLLLPCTLLLKRLAAGPRGA
jgi:hypothetical protein